MSELLTANAVTITTAVTIFESTSIVPAVIFTEGGSKDLLETITAYARSIDKDISTEAGRDNIRSVAYKITRTKGELDKMRKAVKDEAQRTVDAVDAEGKKIRDSLDALAEETRAPLTEWENKEKKRVLQHEAGLVALSLQSEWRDMPEPDIAAIQVRIGQVTAVSLDGWEEFTARATAIKETVLRDLDGRLEGRTRYEAQQAELERLRAEESARLQKLRDDRIAEEAAATAKKAAEDKAAADAKELADKVAADTAKAAADLKAAQDREAAAAQALIDQKAKAERDQAAALKKQQDDAATAKKAEDDDAARRAADVEHKKKINNEALKPMLEAFEACKLDGAEAHVQAVLIAIIQGKVPHVKITY